MNQSPSSQAIRKKIKELVGGIIAGSIMLVLYVPIAWVWFWFLPSERMDEWPLTFMAGITTGIALVIFGGVSIVLIIGALCSIKDSISKP